MAFQDNFYQLSDGGVCLYRVSDEEAAAVDAATGPATLNFHAYSSGSRKRFGIHTRGVTLSRTVGTAPNQFSKSTFLSIPTTDEYDALSISDTISINSVAWTVKSKVPEKFV